MSPVEGLDFTRVGIFWGGTQHQVYEVAFGREQWTLTVRETFFSLVQVNKYLVKLEIIFASCNSCAPSSMVSPPIKKSMLPGFPGGTVVESLPANAGDTGSSPGLGRSHMPRSSWAREPQLLSLRVWSLCSATREAAVVRGPRTVMKSGPRLPQLEKALAQKRRPNTAIN